ncbi:TetR/AcrR family transcriptional regulator [Desulfoluna sp.]|uniref:TetR/AcrR family transcriptional regulator n=1 Tax=Desulfoluna sp. TaxID=2045199 RepID=UPI00260915BF|nr:TetR/AcrR family transcriptional regulator [Desulfoluna sp.]
MGKEEKRQRVYEAALLLFSRHGFKKTTVEDIADALGMTKGNLYLYARNKKDLYESAVAWSLRNWQRASREVADAEESCAAKIYAYFITGYRYLESDQVLRRLITHDQALFPLTEAEDRFHEINQASRNILAGYLAEGIETGEFRPFEVEGLAELLYSFYVMLVIKRYLVPGKVPSQESLNIAFNLILKGLLA